jgi:large subunit ribosomal protein L18
VDNKKHSRLRRAGRTRAKIKVLGIHRLSVYRTPRHIYAQILTADGAVSVASASTLDRILRSEGITYGGNSTAAALVGKAIAERAKAAGITQVAFDRSGYKYHGRIKALAEAARAHGLEF